MCMDRHSIAVQWRSHGVLPNKTGKNVTLLCHTVKYIRNTRYTLYREISNPSHLPLSVGFLSFSQTATINHSFNIINNRAHVCQNFALSCALQWDILPVSYVKQWRIEGNGQSRTAASFAVRLSPWLIQGWMVALRMHLCPPLKLVQFRHRSRPFLPLLAFPHFLHCQPGLLLRVLRLWEVLFWFQHLWYPLWRHPFLVRFWRTQVWQQRRLRKPRRFFP